MPPRRHRQPSAAATLLRRTALLLLSLLLLAVAAGILLINGENIKKPLQDLLQQQTGQECRIARAEFSPLYPNIIKLTGFSLGELQADEIYLDYDLRSLLPQEKTLHINELYIRALRGLQHSAGQLLLQLAAPKSLQIDVLRLQDLPLQSWRLQAGSAALRLHGLQLSEGQEPVLASGSAQLQEVLLDQLPLKSLRVEFAWEQDQLLLPSLQAELAGGVVSGRGGRLDAAGNSLSFEQLDLSRLICRDGLQALAPYSISAERGRLQELFFAPGPQLSVQQLSAEFTDLKLQEGQLSVQLQQGTASGLALPDWGLNLEDLSFAGTIQDTGAALTVSGQLLQGSFGLDFTWDRAGHTLDVHDLWLQNNKIEFHRRQIERLQEAVGDLEISLDSARGENLRLLSFMDDFPLSAEQLNLQASALKFAAGRLQGASAGLFSLNFANLSYADLFFMQGTILAALSADMLNLNVPQLMLQRSELSGALALSFSRAPSFLLINAPELNLSDLNCALIPHLLQGQVSLNLDLRAPGPFTGDWQQLIASLQGRVSLKSPGLLISHLGLDLINGGPAGTLEYPPAELYQALRQADTGIYELSLTGSFSPGRGTLSGSFDTPASHVFLNLAADLKQLTLSGQSNMFSYSGDARTRVTLSGSLSEPLFTLEARERGMERPGLQPSGDSGETVLPEPEQERVEPAAEEAAAPR